MPEEKQKLIKVRLTDRGEDTETPWAEDLGPAPSSPSARRARLVNVPFFHAKPTYGDVIVVEPDPDDGVLTWDSGGVDFDDIDSRIDEDGGRYALIVDYALHEGADVNIEFATLCRAARSADVMPEGAWPPKDDQPGRLYLAAPDAMAPHDVVELLRESGAACELTLEHPIDDDDEPS